MKWLSWLKALLIVYLLYGAHAGAAPNMRFYGSLIAEPCVLDLSTTDITLDFGDVIDKYLYLNTRTFSKPFTIRLLECDTTLGNSVEMTFMGNESAELPGYLTLTSGSAHGIVIGMALPDGTHAPINRPITRPLGNGTTQITLNAYVEAEPSALQNHTIGLGDFSAITTFYLNYP